jgi:hypothetical protein
MHLSTLVKRVATVLVLVAALINGLTAPLAHGHVLMGPPAHGAPVDVAWPSHSELDQAADDCEASHEDAQASHDPGDRSHGQVPGKMQLMCSGGSSCCAAVAMADLPVMVNAGRIGTFVGLPLSLIGLTPPVGERPPLLLHV